MHILYIHRRTKTRVLSIFVCTYQGHIHQDGAKKKPTSPLDGMGAEISSLVWNSIGSPWFAGILLFVSWGGFRLVAQGPADKSWGRSLHCVGYSVCDLELRTGVLPGDSGSTVGPPWSCSLTGHGSSSCVSSPLKWGIAAIQQETSTHTVFLSTSLAWN